MTQFADDTTLILNGSQSSLQAALNTNEIFGSFSGLHMNTNKTKVIWIGRKKYSKDKLKVSVNLDWGTTQFKLLGIIFFIALIHPIQWTIALPVGTTGPAKRQSEKCR